MSEPKKITAGNSYDWVVDFGDYSPVDGWSLHYSIVNNANIFNVDATDDGTVYQVSIPTAESALYPEGEYKLIGYVSSASERVTLYSDRLIVQPDFTKISDFRSYSEKVLDAINATIAKAATKDQQSVTVDGQTLARRTYADLLVLRDRFKTAVAAERRADKIKKSGKIAGHVSVRFTR